MVIFMRTIFAAALITLSLATNLAQADGRAFPPDNCTAESPFMAFTGVDGSNTFCNSGQDVLSNALPDCQANQQVAFDGTRFVCENKPAPPVCTANQVLTYTASGFVCVTKGAEVPTCTANELLTYNGDAFQCAAGPSNGRPCGQAQVDGFRTHCDGGGGCKLGVASYVPSSSVSNLPIPSAPWEHGRAYTFKYMGSVNNYVHAQCWDGVITFSNSGN